MDNSHVRSGLIARSAMTVTQMIAEGHHADAVAFLFYMHKTHLQEWVLVKRALLASVNSSKSLQTLASILEASKRSSLSESARTIPGLADFLHEDPIQELLD